MIRSHALRRGNGAEPPGERHGAGRFAKSSLATLAWMTILASIAGIAPTAAATSHTVPNAPRALARSLLVAAPTIHVSGNRIVDSNGDTVRLLGVNRPGAEYACIEGWGIFDGPTNTDAAVAAIASWGTTAVRLPLNEDCWLGINGVSPKYGGANYQNAVIDYVNRLNAHGQLVIINLHFSAPGAQKATGQQPMADRDHADAFWSSVAGVFKDNHSVLFDLYNEPYPNHNRNGSLAWSCVLSGGTCRGVSFTAAGMQEMTDAVRAAGATEPLMIGGPQYAGDVDRWLAYEPTDPLHQLVASIHIYGPDWAPCWLQTCWDSDIAPLALQVPVVVGEMGNIDCTDSEIDPLMDWSDAHGVSYLAWGWLVAGCKAEPALITSYDGTPTAYGNGLRDHLLGQSLAG